MEKGYGLRRPRGVIDIHLLCPLEPVDNHVGQRRSGDCYGVPCRRKFTHRFFAN